MNSNDLIQAYVFTGQKIDVLWNFYVTVHLAIAGFLLALKTKIKWPIATALSVAYLGFSIINYRAKAIEYDLLNSLISDIALIDTGHKSIDGFFNQQDFSDRTFINIIVHIFSIILIIIIYKYSNSKNNDDS